MVIFGVETRRVVGLLDPGCQVTVRGGGFSPTKRHDSRSTRLVKEATRPSYATTRHWHVSSALGQFWVCLVKVEPAWHGKQANGRLETIFEMICIFFLLIKDFALSSWNCSLRRRCIAMKWLEQPRGRSGGRKRFRSASFERIRAHVPCG